MTAGISILMYHQVGDFAPMTGHRSTYCHYQRFAAQMAYLHRFGYNVISLSQAQRALSGETAIPARAVVLTFDDGYENFYEYAYPELTRYGFPAMVYLISGFLGRNADWFGKDGRDTPPLMGRERILELAGAGVDFGAHGVSHVKLAEIDPERMRKEIRSSREELSNLLGHEVAHFCYPYGNYNTEVREAARQAGYNSAVTCVRGAATRTDDPLELPRKAISYGDSLAGYWWKLHIKNARKD